MRLQEMINVYFCDSSDNTVLHSVKLPVIPAVGHNIVLKGRVYIVENVTWIDKNDEFGIRIQLKHL